jgi:hypothetical protein
MKISREWATPLTIGAFGLMALTGVLMFFHLDTGLNKLAHEWLSWLMLAAVVAHASTNWLAFKRYFLSSRTGRGILIVSALVIAASFAPKPGRGDAQASPSALAIKSLSQAPLAQVAPLTGKPVEQIMAQLAAAGIQVTRADQSLAQVLGNDRDRIGKAIKIVLGAAPGAAKPGV